MHRTPIRQKKSRNTKSRPANEVTEAEIQMVIEAIQGFDGYPKLRQVADLVPALTPYKLNVIIRFLERSGTILIDGDGFIVWTRGEVAENLSLSEVAKLSPEFKKLLGRTGD